MEWTPGGVSNDVEDRRDDSGGGGGGFGFGGFHMGIGSIILVGLLSLLFHRNLFVLFSDSGSTPARVESRPNPARDRAEDTEVQFVSYVLDDVQKNGGRVLPEIARVPYRHAKLVLFRDSYPSGSGMAQTAIEHSTAPSMRKSISIWGSSTNSGSASTRPANLPKRT